MTKESDVLLEIYIKQHIRREGVLASDFSNRKEIIAQLRNFGYIEPLRYYKFDTLLCTENGAISAGKSLQESIQKRRDNIKSIIDQIPKPVLRFLARDCVRDSSTWPVNRDYFTFFDWRRIPLEDDRIWTISFKLFSDFETEGLVLRTSDYVSTRGGELRESKFTFSSEVNSILKEAVSNSIGLTVDESKPFRIAYFLQDVSPYFAAYKGADPRELVWQKMEAYFLSEEDLKKTLQLFSEKQVTSVWNGFLPSKPPFEILDPVAFKISISTMLVKPGIDKLLTSSVKPSNEQSQPGTSTIDSGFERMGSLFNDISLLEITLRNLIEERLSKLYGKTWANQIPQDILQNWEGRKKDDIRESQEPESELINYADFSDYARIIEKFKSPFRDFFPDVSKTVVILNEINSIRKRVMHSRTITDEAYYSALRWIRWLKDRLPQNSTSSGEKSDLASSNQ
jgi:hypothetical protein